MQSNRMMKRAVGIINEVLACKICKSILNEPTSLGCNHHFCRYCLDEELKAAEPKCLECQLPIRPSDLRRNQHFASILESWITTEQALKELGVLKPPIRRLSARCAEAKRVEDEEEELEMLLTADIDEKLGNLENDRSRLNGLIQQHNTNAAVAKVIPYIKPQGLPNGYELFSDSSDSEIEIKPKRKRRRRSEAMVNRLTYSGCAADEIRTIRTATKSLGGHVTSSFSFEPDTPLVMTTHVICHWSENDKRCRRTLKTMLALASGQWIVDYSWVTESIKAGKWLDEAAFQVLGDHTWTGIVPSREQRMKPVLSGMNCMIFGSSLSPKDISVTDLRRLLAVAGGNSSAWRTKRSMTDRIDVMLVGQDDSCDHPSIDVPIVKVTWVFDSISRFQVPFNDEKPECDRSNSS